MADKSLSLFAQRRKLQQEKQQQDPVSKQEANEDSKRDVIGLPLIDKSGNSAASVLPKKSQVMKMKRNTDDMASSVPKPIDPMTMAAYEDLINVKMKKRLQFLLDQRDSYYTQVSEHQKLREYLMHLLDHKMILSEQPDDENEELSLLPTGRKMLVDLGSNVYVQAKRRDRQFVFLSVGYGFFVQLEHDEARFFLDRKITFLEKHIQRCTEQAMELKSHITILLASYSQLVDQPSI